jgi:ADP-heptose:LPS heptosyltransferase
MVQLGVINPKWIAECDDLDLRSVPREDFYETARLLNALDVTVSIDTASLHLAGAMGRKTIGLLSEDADYRWKYKWYDSVKILKGNDWEKILDAAIAAVKLYEAESRL